MTAAPPEFKHMYIAILRCRTWCDWPASSRFISRAYDEPISLPNGDRVCLSVHIATYAQRPRPETSPARPLAATAGPIVWRGHLETGYALGFQIVKAPEDSIPITLNHEPPYEGDIDIQLHIGSPTPLPTDQLAQLASQVCTSMLAFINLAFGDLATPVAPVQLRELRDDGSQFANSLILAVRERRPVTSELATDAVHGFAQKRVALSPREARALDVAARRYLTSLTETDPVDKYCDLWESCEFGTMFERAKGGKVASIAQALAAHLMSSGFAIAKARLERSLEIKALYEARGRIVHEAIDSPHEFQEKTRLLEAIASELLRYRFGLPCNVKGPIADRLPMLFTPPRAGHS
jgi:hypothetical protein